MKSECNETHLTGKWIKQGYLCKELNADLAYDKCKL